MATRLHLSSVLFRQIYFVKKLRLFSLLAYAFIIFVMLSSLLLTLYAARIINESSTILAITNREHMLTQRISSDALASAFLEEKDYHQELSTSLNEWQQNHDALLQGNAQLDVRPLHNAQPLAVLQHASFSYNIVREMTQLLLQQKKPAAMHTEAMTILHLSNTYCEALEKIALFEQANNTFSVRFTILCPVISGALIFIVLLVTYLLSHRPLFKQILVNIAEMEYAQDHAPPSTQIVTSPLDPQRFRISSSVKLY
jgi:hypothetical protein